MTENSLDIEFVLKFESLEDFKGRKVSLARAALKITKIQNFKLRKVKYSSVWRYDKNIPLLSKKKKIDKTANSEKIDETLRKNPHLVVILKSIFRIIISIAKYYLFNITSRLTLGFSVVL